MGRSLDTASYSELLLSYALHGAKLSLADVKQTDMPASDVPASLLGGHAVAGVTWAPNISMITAHKGFHIIYTSAEAPGLITDNFSVKTGFLKAHPGAMPAIIKGFLKGAAFDMRHSRQQLEDVTGSACDMLSMQCADVLLATMA